MGVEIISALSTGFGLLVLTAHDLFSSFYWYVLFQLYDPHEADLMRIIIIASQQGRYSSHRNQHPAESNINMNKYRSAGILVQWPAQTPSEVRQ